MEQNYWDLDDILADNQKLPCTFPIDVPNLGHLDGTNQHIKANTRLSLPFWLAELLALHELITIHIPKPFAPRIRAALDAEPTSVKLRNLSPSWYALGVRIGGLMDSPELMGLLSKTYISRLNLIYNHAQHLASSSNEDSDPSKSGGQQGKDGSSSSSAVLTPEMMDFLNGMEEAEKSLLHTATSAARAMREYLSGSS